MLYSTREERNGEIGDVTHMLMKKSTASSASLGMMSSKSSRKKKTLRK